MFFRKLTTAAALVVAAVPSAAIAAWTEARSRHFIVYSEQKPAELQRYAQQLERFDAAVRKLRGMSDPVLSDSGKITIYVLRNQAQVAKIAGRPGSTVAGFYIGRVSGPLAYVHHESSRADWDLDGQTVFFHEYLHHLMLSETDAALPGWFVEGSAELFATARFRKDGSMVFGYAPQYRSYGLFTLDSLSTQDMIGATKVRLTGDQVEQVYGRGWLLTHYLTFGAKERKGQLGRYITGIQQGQTALDSARTAFGDLAQLDRELKTYLTSRRLSGVEVPAAQLGIAPIRLRPLGAGEAAIIPVRMLSERGVSEKEAKTLVEDARRVAQRFPAEPEVLASLAEAEHDAGNNQAAIAAADRALAAAPNHQRAMIMKSRALLTVGEADSSKMDWKALRALIGRANRLDPDNAEPLMLFYRTYLAQGVAPTKNSVEGLFYAQALVPQDRTLRMMAVHQLVSENKLPQARRLFGPIAYDPHAGKNRQRLIGIMDALGAGDSKKARDVLDKVEQGDEEENGKKS